MLPNQMFNAVLSSLRTFDPLSDTLDILIISFVFYQLLQLLLCKKIEKTLILK